MDDWKVPLLRLNVYPAVPPVAVAVIAPVFVSQGVVPVTVLVTLIVTPVHTLGAANVKLAVPEQPFPFFAMIVKTPSARLLKVPDGWNTPPLILNVIPVLPVAVATILPLAATDDVGLVIVPVTVIVTPAHRLGAVNINEADPEQPFPFFAVRVYEPAARLVKLPDD